MKKEDKKIIIYAFFIAFVCLFICSCNSPLYPFNDWVDENAFMTVGKTWLHGFIPYRDIFEQKGPFLYLIFLVANIISQKSFIGVFIIEIISFTISLIFISKIIQLFTKRHNIYLILPIFAAIISYSPFFSHGGSAEELCFPYLIYGIYSLLKLFKYEQLSTIEYLINGLCAGIVFMIKFNLIGFWFGFFISQFLITIKEKKTQNIIKNNIIFIITTLTPTLLFSIYFYMNNGFRSFIDTYFLFNSNTYSHKMSFSGRIITDFKLFYDNLTSNWLIMTLMYVGLIIFLLNKKYINRNYKKLLLIFTFIMSFIGIYFGGFSYPYYFLFMTPYIIFGLIVLFDKINIKRYIITYSFCIIISIYLILQSNNIYFMKYKKNDLIQYKYAKIMKKNKAKTLLNYGFLDSGFYMTADILPSVRYFELQNASVEGMNEVLGTMIDNKEFDYIVVIQPTNYNPTIREIYEKYDLIRKDKQKFEKMNVTYYLYKAKGM